MTTHPYTPGKEPISETVEFDGAKFATVNWKVPSGTTYKGKIIYVHGFCEASDVYREFFDKISDQGYEVFFFDQRGSGETSPGNLRGLTNEYHAFNDLDFFIKRNLDDRKDKSEKFILMGHSMGGGIILNYGIHGKYINEFKAIVACAPLITNHPKLAPAYAVKKAGTIAARIMPNFRINTKLEINDATGNDKYREYIRQTNAKYIGGLALLRDMLSRGEALLNPDYAAKFNPNVALLIVHAPTDHINYYKSTKQFFDLLPNNIDKELYTAEGGSHSLFYDREEITVPVVNKVLEFLAKH